MKRYSSKVIAKWVVTAYIISLVLTILFVGFVATWINGNPPFIFPEMEERLNAVMAITFMPVVMTMLFMFAFSVIND